MYSRFLRSLDADFTRIKDFAHFRIAFFALIIITCVGLYLKYALRRRSHIKSYPSRKVGFFNILGHVTDFVQNAKVKGLNINVYLLQILMGYQRLFKNESFYLFDMSFFPYVIATKAKAVEKLISGSKNMEKNWMYDWLHPWLGTGLLTSHGSKWKTRRKLLTPSFHFEILKDFLLVFNEQSQLFVQLLEKETKQPWIDIVQPVTLCSLDIICETTLGVSVGAQKNSESEYVRAVSRASEVFMKRSLHPLYFIDWYFNLSSDGRQFKRDVKLLHNFTRTIIADKKQKLLSCTEEAKESNGKKKKALMDLLLEEHMRNGTLTEEDIREEVDTFAFEGHDTTSMGMSWALYLLGLNKDAQEKVHEEIDRVFGDDYERSVTTDDLKDLEYLDRVLKESQRLYPSVPGFGRTLSEDATLCQRFAVMEEKVVIVNILRNYSIESLDSRDKVLVAPELILRAAVPIRVKLKSRRPPSS